MRLLPPILALFLLGCASAPPRDLPPLAEVDLPRFMGAWHVIANVPYWLEEGKVATRDEYRLREDGRIENVYVFRRGFDRPEKRWEGVSTVQPGSDGARWSVQFVWPFSADLEVLEIDPDYQWALLSNPRRSLAWLLARDPAMSEARYAELVQRFRRHAVDPARLLRVPQFPEQVGQPGFQ
ncbi:lipocalin family protein [Pseudomarimonas salicorniae]|uniref:Outer membrane lipoprotein Blc n=1 Tax=Pseudomarimonas salicorniae TaxID=2933270 RepID=A0ABT0GM62_9GAMM|nr:lipocalin family protein [Lysobacter sp. CAU 1642]MCK7595600.1 lipocalin family protein [Lysobacter sp. CAU 1642]